MLIAIAAATQNEIRPTVQWLQGAAEQPAIWITGVGPTATAYSLMHHMRQSKPDLVIQAGIAGSYSDRFPPGTTVLVQEEVLADLGALDHGDLSDIFDMGFQGHNDYPFANRRLPNPHLGHFAFPRLPRASGATVSTVSSGAAQVQRIIRKYGPDVESMEGAALHYVCLMEQVRFMQLRSVSNYAGERDKSKWNLPSAIEQLNMHLQQVLLESAESLKLHV